MVIRRGGTDEERLYLYDLKFDCGDDICIIKKTDIPNIDLVNGRHGARYHFAAAFCRSGDKVLDFPCGSGYGTVILSLSCPIEYEGRDIDLPTIEYAKIYHGNNYLVDDLTNPHLQERYYNVIACIEGIEHIEEKYHIRLMKYFYDALKYGGILVVTTPEKGTSINPYHKYEMTRGEFEVLLKWHFKNESDIQIITMQEKNHRGEKTNFMYGVCRKDD